MCRYAPTCLQLAPIFCHPDFARRYSAILTCHAAQADRLLGCLADVREAKDTAIPIHRHLISDMCIAAVQCLQCITQHACAVLTAYLQARATEVASANGNAATVDLTLLPAYLQPTNSVRLQLASPAPRHSTPRATPLHAAIARGTCIVYCAGGLHFVSSS